MVKNSIVEFIMKVEEISKVGLMYSTDPYARDNYEQLQKLAKTFIADQMNIDLESGNFFARDIYPTPNVSVRTIVFNKERNKVLLVREKSDGGFSLPGGWAELCYSPSESALKEVWEEAGSKCKLVRLVGVFDRYNNVKTTGIPEYMIAYEGEIVEEVNEPCFEIIEKGFYPIDDLPQWSAKNNPVQMEKIIAAAIKKETLFD